MEQELFESEQHSQVIFDALGDPRIKIGVKEDIPDWSAHNGQEVWNCIQQEINKLISHSTDRKKHEEMVTNSDKVILMHTYPRLDVAVSKTMNHLLKAPFCVHPKTGRICVPIDTDNIWDFNPENVLTVQEVVNQLQEALTDKEASCQGTALDPYLQYFQKFADQALDAEKLT